MTQPAFCPSRDLSFVSLPILKGSDLPTPHHETEAVHGRCHRHRRIFFTTTTATTRNVR